MTSRVAEPHPSIVPYWHGIYWLALVGLVLRIAFSLTADNLYHPDEVFQYLEPAHRLVFGYGLITWEYRFGTRSWLIPFFISAPLYLCKILHIDKPDIYIPLVKSIFCLVSTSLIFSGYAIGRRLVSEATGRLTAVLCCFWYELIYFSSRPLADVVSAYFLVGALACVVVAKELRRPYLFGFLTAMSLALRVQYAPVVGVIILFAVFNWNKECLAKAAIASVAVIILAGWVDWLMWGGWFVSYYNNYLFNVIYGVSKLFGEEGFNWYFTQLAIASMGIFELVFMTSLCFLRRLWLPFLCIAVLIVEHMLIPHKEYRFIFATIPLFLMQAAAIVVLVSDKLASAWSAKSAQWVTICVLGFISVEGILNQLPGENDSRIYEFNYGHQPHYVPDHIFQAFKFLYHEKNLAGVFIPSVPWSLTGGYYYLHRDVPLYFTYSYSDYNEVQQNPAAYVSHIMSFSDETLPGFSEIARFGDAVIQKQKHLPVRYLRPPSYDRAVFMPGIDDKYQSTVTPRAIDYDSQ